jgi:hypothetical protein
VRIIALVVWSATAFSGLHPFWRWFAAGGIRGQATKVTRFPLMLVFAHPLFALTGLCCWIGYVLTGRLADAGAAFAVMCASALPGFALLTRWLTGERGRHARGGEERVPPGEVVLHGIGGIVTFVLVLITVTIASQR